MLRLVSTPVCSQKLRVLMRQDTKQNIKNHVTLTFLLPQQCFNDRVSVLKLQRVISSQ